RRAQTALREAHDKFAGAFQSSVDAMLVVKIGSTPGSGTIIDANDAVPSVFGRTPRELKGQRISDAIAFFGDTDISDVRQRLLKGEVVRGMPLRVEGANGSVVDLELSGSTYTLNGETLALVILRDVTERNATEQRIKELNESLEESLGKLRAI